MQKNNFALNLFGQACGIIIDPNKIRKMYRITEIAEYIFEKLVKRFTDEVDGKLNITK